MAPRNTFRAPASPVPRRGQPVHFLFGAQELDVHMDATEGNDGNSGLSPDDALRTFAGLYSKFPVIAADLALVRVWLAPGPNDTQAVYATKTLFAGGGQSHINTFVYKGPKMVPWLPTQGPHTVPLANVTNVADATGRRTMFEFAGDPNWLPGDLRKRFLRVMRGADLVFFETPICGNSANTLWLDVDGLADLIQPGDTIEVVRPGARIGATRGSTHEIIGHGASSGNYRDDRQGQMFERLEFMSPSSSQVWGVTFDRCLALSYAFTGGSAAFVNSCAAFGIAWACDSVFATVPPHAERPGSPIHTHAQFEILTPQLMVGTPGNPGNYTAKRNVSCYGGWGAGIEVTCPGSLFYAADWADGGFDAALQGDGNVYGIRCQLGAQAVILNQAPGQCIITGSAGDLVVSDGPPIRYAEFASAYAGNFTRMLESGATGPLYDTSRITTRRRRF